MSEGYRRAALALRAVPNADRDWVLGQLATGQRQRLSAMLVEISRLGFDVGAEDLARLLGDGPRAGVMPAGTAESTAEGSITPAEAAVAEPLLVKPAEPTPPMAALAPAAAARERIGRAEATALLPWLKNEPGALIAALAGLADGPWQAALRQARPDARAFATGGAQLHTQLHAQPPTQAQTAPTPAMADALLLALAARLDAAHDKGTGERPWSR